MKILVLGENFPWPANGGGLIRLANAVEALASMGDVDLFTLCDRRRVDRTVPESILLARVGTTPYPEAAHALRWRSAWIGRGGFPVEVAMRRFDPSPKASLRSWTSGPYDLVWVSTAAAYEWFGRPHLGPTVIDLVDLEDEKERQRGDLLRRKEWGRGTAWFRGAVAWAQSWVNARDWGALQRSSAGQVDRVVLASPLDVRRSGLGNARFVTNALRRPERPLGRTTVGNPPSILFQGSLNYAPNMDGAAWLVDELGDRIRALIPGCQIRLVGRPTPAVERLHHPPQVTVVGRVPDMDPELERADIAVVPVRFGSGTRVKILESFAHRIPVVSTTLGAEGLEATDGEHLLIADDADAFAHQCQRLITQPELRAQLVTAAERLFFRRYELAVARDQVREVVHELLGTGSEA